MITTTIKTNGNYNTAVIAQEIDVKGKIADLDNKLIDVVYWEVYLGLMGGVLMGKIANLLLTTIKIEEKYKNESN